MMAVCFISHSAHLTYIFMPPRASFHQIHTVCASTNSFTIRGWPGLSPRSSPPLHASARSRDLQSSRPRQDLRLSRPRLTHMRSRLFSRPRSETKSRDFITARRVISIATR